MSLPTDFRPTAATLRREERLDLGPLSAGEASRAAAFAILIYRYAGLPEVRLELARRGADGAVLARAGVALAFEAGTRCGEPRALLSAVIDELGGAGELEAAHLSPSGGADLALRGTALVYDAALFKRTTVERAAGHLLRALARVEAEPDAAVSGFPLLGDAERALIAAACDGPPRSEPPPLVHRLVEAWAERTPAATAARHRAASLTYGELNGRANALARKLLSLGAVADVGVAVCLEPSLDLPVALLAILKAGAVYVPLDPTHPEARLRAQLAELEPRVLITQTRLLEKLAPDGPAVLTADDLEESLSGVSRENLGLEHDRERAAYVYFTSGTTGKPKGALASQGNLAAYIAAARERYALGPADVMPAIARFSFSISMFELTAPLTAGGTLIVLDRDHVVDPERLAKTLEQVTIFHAGPSLLKSLTAHIKRRGGFEAFARVRHASSGGDMVPPELLETLKEIFSNAEVFVIYGCSEIACMGCTYPVPRERVVERTYVGRPFAGVSVRVLDPALNELPPGVVGEICFSGEGVVKGYLDRPDLTAEKFVALGGRRFYRTGDLGRLSEDGWLEILGRSDFQVKLRGIRVELGEIEHYLRRAAGVRDGVVMPMPLGMDEKALVAYIVMDRDRPLEPGASPEAAIREHMAKHLPEYMLPAAYVELDSLPLNHNMKVDRKALPPPAARRRADDGRRRAPSTGSEKKLAAIWEKLLGLERAGLDDRFFELGGHSLLGLQLIVEVERELGASLKGLELVRENLEGLAALCDERLGRARPAAEGADGPEGPVPLALRVGDGGSLHAVWTGPEKAAKAALICPPPGQDGARAQFVLRRLAERLAEAGVPSLRFDLYGCGDSLGESFEAGPARWLRDISSACAELRRRSGAGTIAAVGARLSATLLARAARDLALSPLVAWDPVDGGADHLLRAARLHEGYVGGWRSLFRPPPALEGAVELLGLTLSESATAELAALRFAPCGAVKRLDSASLSADPGWEDLARLGDVMPDPGFSKALAALVLEGA